MQQLLRAAVIGAGSMGTNHARVYSDLDGVTLVAVADPDAATAERLAQRYHCKCYGDYRAMIEQEQLDLVSVVVPTKHHYSVAADVIEAGVSLLIEKPIAATVQQGRALIESARRRGVLLTVGHIERYNPAIIALRQQLEQHALGHVFQIVARRVGPFPSRIMDVGVVVDLATHELDILRYLTGQGIARMQVELGRHIHNAHEDLLSAILRFDDGVVGMLDINWLTPAKIRELSIIGERGMFVANYLTQDLTFFENDSCQGGQWPHLAVMGVSEGRMIRHKVQRREPLREELAAFSRAVRGGSPPLVSGEDALVALEEAQRLVAIGSAAQPIQALEMKAVGLS